MKKATEYLNSVLKDNDTVIIGVSSGPDSMCLFSLAQKLNKKINIICAHVNHKTRRKCDKEYEYLEQYCKDNNITFEGLTINTKIKNNFESEARKVRYAFFESLYHKYNAKYILTAHHSDDQIETILMRLSRGSTLNGYAGIKRIDGKYLRPLLDVDKKEIIKYLNKNNIKYYVDHTNKEDEHQRNRFRHHVVTFLKKENNKVGSKYQKFSEELLSYDEFINDYIKDNKLINNGVISITKLLKEKPFIRRKTIELLIKSIQSKDLMDVSDKNMDDILKMIESKKSNLHINLHNNYVCFKDYDELSIRKSNDNKDYSIVFKDIYEDSNFIIKKSKTTKKSNYIIRLDSSEIKLPLIIRNKKDSDVIDAKNSGHQKLKNIFIDSKIKKSLRDTYPIVCDSNDNILWIPGIKKSKFDKENDQKCDIILLCERKSENEKRKEK